VDAELLNFGISGKEKLTHNSLENHSFAAGFRPFA
jgi:hypothetical protein